MRKSRNGRCKTIGFTLIELMIAIAIVALIAALGVPAYERYVQKAKRADAQTALLELANFMERNYAKNGSYLINGAAPALPITTTPRDATVPSYRISFSNIAQQTYTLQAQPTAASGQNTEPCGTLTLAHTGVTTPSTGNCWIQ